LLLAATLALWARSFLRPFAVNLGSITIRSDAGHLLGLTSHSWFFPPPYWSISLAAAVLPLLWYALKLLGYPGFGPNSCRRCGYDLRATPDRCPEYGTVPPGKIKNSS